MNHEEYKEMLAVFALDALDETESRSLQMHLSECAPCRVELDQLREAVSALVYTVPPVEPSPELRARVLEIIKSETSLSSATETQSKTRTDGASPSAQALPNVTVLPQTRRPYMLMIGTLAASVAIAALAISLAVLWNRNNELQRELAQLSRSLNETRKELAREREDRELLAAPDVRIATLAGTDMAPRARAKLAYDRRTGRAIFYAYDLPPAPAGKAYQLWFIAGGKPVPGQVFTTDAVGHVEMRDQIPADGLNATIFAVTLEQSAGVSTPTGDKYLLSAAS